VTPQQAGQQRDQDSVPGKGRSFQFTASRTVVWASQSPVKWVLAALSLGVKAAGAVSSL